MTTFTFYDSGFLEAALLPKSLRKAAQKLNGRKLTLNEALISLLPVIHEVGGELRVEKTHIDFLIGNTPGHQVIRYR